MTTKKIKGIISTILILSGLVTFSTGAVLYFVDYGMWLWFTRKSINDAHALFALIMGLTVIIHLILNRHIYKNEMKALINSNNNIQNKQEK